MNATPHRLSRSRATERGSVLIIVIWVCLGAVALALYSAQGFTSEFRAADYRVAELQARQAVAAGTRYAAYQLTQYATSGTVPRPESIRAEALPVGDAQFWFIGRNNDQTPTSEPYFGLIDEGSKLNLNTATRTMLEGLPGITPDVVDAIIAWRSRNGGDDGSYGRLEPARTNKAGPFETVDELRLVYGMTMEMLLGEDTNRNGALDLNENDGDGSAPRDDQNGILLPGIAEFVTVYSSQPATRASGSGRRINIQNQQGRAQLGNILRQRFTAERATQILRLAGNREFNSVLEFAWDTELTTDELVQIQGDIAHRDGAIAGLVNVDTASETVLACLPGIGTEYASALVSYRLAHPDALTSLAWVKEVLPRPERCPSRALTSPVSRFTFPSMSQPWASSAVATPAPAPFLTAPPAPRAPSTIRTSRPAGGRSAAKSAPNCVGTEILKT
jgi:DNA uptake protein ComE-like DNA-binding protein